MSSPSSPAEPSATSTPLLRSSQGESSSSWFSLRRRSEPASAPSSSSSPPPPHPASASTASSSTSLFPPLSSPSLDSSLDRSSSEEPPAISVPISPALPLTAFSLGFISGLLSSAQRASLVFMAENAHRRPDTVQGWYFYNKTKNYKVLLAGLQGGAKAGVRLAGWVGVWAFLERGVAEGRRKFAEGEGSEGRSGMALIKDMTWPDGALAGQIVGGIAAAVYRLSPTRMLLLGTMAGASTGGLRDLKNWLERARELELSKGTSTNTPVPASLAR